MQSCLAEKAEQIFIIGLKHMALKVGVMMKCCLILLSRQIIAIRKLLVKIMDFTKLMNWLDFEPQSPDFILVKLQNILNILGIRTIDSSGVTQMGTAIVQIPIKEGVRSGSGKTYVDPNPHPNNLHFITRVFVIKYCSVI